MMRHVVRIEALLILPLMAMAVSAGCGDDPDNGGVQGLPLTADEAVARADSNVRANLDVAVAALGFLSQADVLNDLVNAVIEREDCGDDGGCDALDADFEQLGSDAASWIAENLFDPDLVVTETATTLVFELPVDLWCGEEPDTDCLELWQEVPIRLRVSAPSADELHVDVLVGNPATNPLDLHLGPAELAVEVDLAEVRASLEQILRASGAEIDSLGSMRGRFDLVLRALGEGAVRLTSSVTEAIELRLETDDGRLDLDLEATGPVALLEINAVTDLLVAALELGALDASLPAGVVFGGAMSCAGSVGGEPECVTTPEPGSQVTAHVAGFSGALIINGETEVITVGNLGLGDGTTRMSMDGRDVVTVDLNADTGRQLDVVVTLTERGPELTFSPGIDLAVVLALANLGELADDMSDWLLDDRLTLALTGTDPTVSLSTASAAFQLLAGRLRLTSSARDLEIIVETGDCFWFGDGESEDDHPLAGLLSGTCPD